MSPTPSPGVTSLLTAAHDDAVEVVQHCWRVLKYCQDRELPSLAAGHVVELQRALERARGSVAAAAPLLHAARRARDRDGPVSFTKGLAAASAAELAVLFGDRLWAAVWNAANFHNLRAGGAAPDFGINLPVRDRHERERAYLVRHAVGTEGGCPGWMDATAGEWPALFDLSRWEFELGWERTEAARQHAAGNALSAAAPPLTDTEQKVLDIIRAQPPGAGVTGKEILAALARQGIDLEQSTLTRHVIPNLKRWHGVRNAGGGRGYFIPPT